ncbi:MAG: tyrosine-type recombinase/integrase [Gammaproteobacteria bacterium]|nr:tyrosine-type recombinase/integrase [Gammaproteobacteria bacterium]
MLATINNSLISKLKPSNKPYDVRDDKLTGFLIRVNVSGKLVFMCEYARGKRMTIGKVGVLTPMQARDKAKDMRADAIKGIDPKQAKKTPSITIFKTFIENEYGPWVITHRKDGAATLARIKSCFFKAFQNKKIEEISTLLVEKWQTERVNQGIKPSTINRDIIALKASLSKAMEWGLVQNHPLKNLKLSRLDLNTKISYLTDDEEERLRIALDSREQIFREKRKTANNWRRQRNYDLLPSLDNLIFVDHLKPMVLLSMNTGLRRGELFALTWDDIDFRSSTSTVTGEVAKNGKTRHIPLNKEAIYVLESWRNQTGSQHFVFPSHKETSFYSIKKAWCGILKKANIENFRWHDLRHHFASRLVMASVDLNTVRELLGHSDIQMTLRYAHLAPEHKAEAVARLVSANSAIFK